VTHVTIEPMPLELGLLEAEYGQVVRDLKASGHTVNLRRPVEERSLPGVEETLRGAYVVVLYLADFVKDPIRDALVAILLNRLRARWRRGHAPTRRAAIYGPNNQLLVEVDLPSEEPEDD
jgi:hypothetical protein